MFRTLFGYHWQVRHRLIDGAAALDEGAYREDPGYGHGSVHDLLFHLLQTDRGWRLGLEADATAERLDPADYPDLESLRSGFEAEEAAWDAYLATLTEERIAGDIDLVSPTGRTHTFALWHVLQHLILHGMQHHTELAQQLTRHGHSPGNLDFIFYRP